MSLIQKQTFKTSLWWQYLTDFFASRLATMGFLLLLIILLTVLFAGYIAPQNPYDPDALNIMDGKLAPGSLSQMDETVTFWLGTDKQGRDIFSALLYGLRTSLMVAVISVTVAFVIGSMAGISAAFFGGVVDSVIMRIVDLQLSFPSILIALMLLAIAGSGVDKVIIALVLVQWAYFARAARSAALVEVEKEYIEAARCLALSRSRILWRHIFPNCLPPLIVIATIDLAHAIALESTLSFLGVGVPITEPSLGMLIKNGFEFLSSGMYWISVFPGIALVVVIISFNLVGDHLRDVLNPKNAQ